MQAKRKSEELAPAADGASIPDEHRALSEQQELDDAGVWYALEGNPLESGLLESTEPEADPFLGFAHAAAVGGMFWGALLLFALL